MTGFESNIFGIILSASLTIKLVLLLLLFFSVVSWTIIFQKFSLIRKARIENRAFLALRRRLEDLIQLRKASVRLKQSPLVRVFLSALDRLDLNLAAVSSEGRQSNSGLDPRLKVRAVERTLRRSGEEQLAGLELYLSFLATTGNVTPFVGLFGTVLGIIDAFHEIGRMGSASIAAVAPGVSEALIATAAGLLVAIPAVVAFNYYNGCIRIMASEMDSFSTEFLSEIEEQLIPPVSMEVRPL